MTNSEKGPTMMTTDRTAAERIAEHMQGRSETLQGLYDAMWKGEQEYDTEAADAAEEAREELDMLPLSVETTKTIRVLLSTGGPADGLNVELDRDGNVSRVVYWFADWFDYAETVVTDENSGLYRYAEELAEYEQEMER